MPQIFEIFRHILFRLSGHPVIYTNYRNIWHIKSWHIFKTFPYRTTPPLLSGKNQGKNDLKYRPYVNTVAEARMINIHFQS